MTERGDGPHLLAAISAHGFGHFAQAAPVLNELRRLHPEIRLTIRSGLPRWKLESRLPAPFGLQPVSDDFGVVNTSALDVDVEASAARYRTWHTDWEKRVAQVGSELAAAAPDLLFADVPYLTLAASAKAGIPAVAMCSLHWGDIYWHYCRDLPEAPRVHSEMMAAYRSAAQFLRPAPSMPMGGLDNTRAIGPVCSQGRSRRAEIDRRFGLEPHERLVWIAMGGIAMRLPMENWPQTPGVRWVVQADWQVQRSDVITLEALQMPYPDVLASCDALLTKPGYGSFAEAAAAAVPVLYVSRDDWPEEPCLVEWLKAHGRCAEVPRAELEAGRLGEGLDRLLAAPARTAIPPSGVGEAAAILAERLGLGA